MQRQYCGFNRSGVAAAESGRRWQLSVTAVAVAVAVAAVAFPFSLFCHFGAGVCFLLFAFFSRRFDGENAGNAKIPGAQHSERVAQQSLLQLTTYYLLFTTSLSLDVTAMPCFTSYSVSTATIAS